MSIDVIPEWMVNLEEEDTIFIRIFLMASDSLKKSPSSMVKATLLYDFDLIS